MSRFLILCLLLVCGIGNLCAFDDPLLQKHFTTKAKISLYYGTSTKQEVLNPKDWSSLWKYKTIVIESRKITFDLDCVHDGAHEFVITRDISKQTFDDLKLFDDSTLDVIIQIDGYTDQALVEFDIFHKGMLLYKLAFDESTSLLYRKLMFTSSEIQRIRPDLDKRRIERDANATLLTIERERNKVDTQLSDASFAVKMWSVGLLGVCIIVFIIALFDRDRFGSSNLNKLLGWLKERSDKKRELQKQQLIDDSMKLLNSASVRDVAALVDRGEVDIKDIKSDEKRKYVKIFLNEKYEA